MKNINKIIKIIFITAVFSQIACQKKNFGLNDAQQEFVQGVSFNNKVDIVFMIDNSNTMGKYQGLLADQIPSVVEALKSQGLDFRVVMTNADMSSTGDGGYFMGNPKVISSSMENAATLLAQRIRTPGVGVSDTEKGIRSVMDILSPDYLSTEGAGFLREDALLAVIFMSDEDDESHLGGIVAPANPSDMVEYLDTLKKPFPSGNRAWVANFLGILSNSSPCTTSTIGVPAKEPGFRYIEVVDASGGVKEDICNKNSFESAVKNVKVQIQQLLTDFPLDRKPVLESIKVYINGNLIPRSGENGWDYVASGNLIRFFGSYVPKANDKIYVDFSPTESL